MAKYKVVLEVEVTKEDIEAMHPGKEAEDYSEESFISSELGWLEESFACTEISIEKLKE
jgi:hypothetical protein